ncbi:MAG TPA: membrane protein insertase YidC [Actinomycetes bacterium]|nr:membrane protein insertase YidC [Actinomycetes bacterium]
MISQILSPQLLEPLYSAVTFIMVAFHTLFKTIGMDPAGGAAWSLSIVGLVVVIRIILIPLFVKQINAQRGLQMLQPEIKKIQAKYKGKTDPDTRQKQQQEMMKLYKDNGTNPLASCLPIILQAPIFFALFRVLNGIGKNPPQGHGFLTGHLLTQASQAKLFGVYISDKFIGAPNLETKVLTAILIVLMSATTFTTQKQLMSKNMPADAMNNPFAQQQKILLYVFPLVFAVSGVNFPVGVLLYWLTTNIWSMGQQFYVIRRNPAPGSPAAEALERRKAAREARHHHGDDGPDPSGGVPGTPPVGGGPNGSRPGPVGDGNAADGNGSGPEGGAAGEPPRAGQRQQPKRTKKKK